MNTFTKLAIFILFACFKNIQAQQKAENIIGQMLQKQGHELLEQEKTSEAIDLFDKISPNDSLYTIVKLDQINLLIGEKRAQEALEICELILKEHSSHLDYWFEMNKAIALDRLEKYDSSIAVFQSLEKKFPTSYLVYFNHGITLKNLKKSEQAMEKFMKSIYYQPNHINSHINLGLVMADFNMKTESLLSLIYALTLNPENPNALNIINLAEKILDGSEEGDNQRIKSVDPDDFYKLDLLIENKAALNKKYQLKTKLDYKIFRHLQLVLEKSEKMNNTQGFYSKYYLPFFKRIMNENYFNLYTHHVSMGIENPKIQKSVKKNSKKLAAFHSWLDNTIYDLNSKRYEWLGSDTILTFIYNAEAGTLKEIGTYLDENTQVGPFTLYTPTYHIALKGTFDDKGKKIGTWNWFYYDGKLKESTTFLDDQREGISKQYFPSGKIKYEIPYSKDSIDGEAKIYYEGGELSSIVPYSNGARQGKGYSYHANGKIMIDCNYSNDSLEGAYKYYYPNGELNYIENYKRGKIEGELLVYYNNGKLLRSGQFANQKRTGIWKDFYSNGKLDSEYNYLEGELDGKFIEYSIFGPIYKSRNYNKGKLDGTVVENDYTGNKMVEYVVKNDKFLRIISYEKNGNEKEKFIWKNGSGKITYYNIYRQLSSTGQFESDNKAGEWLTYSKNGLIRSRTYYKDGKENGTTSFYFNNGKIDESVEVKDDQKNGYYQSLYRNENLFSQGYYLNDEEYGPWYYYNIEGKLTRLMFFNNGQMHGKQYTYSHGGKLLQTDKYHFGVIEYFENYDTNGVVINKVEFVGGSGSFKNLYTNGKIMREARYVDNKLEGLVKDYHSNGKIYSEGEFVNNEKEGLWKTYYENGQLQKEEYYLNDELHGKSVHYHKNGKILKEVEYIEGNEHGPIKLYFENGKINKEYNFVYGNAVDTLYKYSPDGKLMYMKVYYFDQLLGFINPLNNNFLPISEKKIDLVLYFENGNKSYEATFENFWNENKEIEYYSNGKVYKVTEYKFGLKEGKETTYNENGIMILEEEFVNSYNQGFSRKYNNQGKMIAENNYYMGNLHGLQMDYKNSAKGQKTFYYHGVIF